MSIGKSAAQFRQLALDIAPGDGRATVTRAGGSVAGISLLTDLGGLAAVTAVLVAIAARIYPRMAI